MEEENKPNYYAIIPADVRYDKRLTANAKLLYGEITSLSNKEGYCWASNSYFAELYEVSEVSISKWINQLINLGYLFSEIKYIKGSVKTTQRSLTFLGGGLKEKFKGGLKEKFKHNNTSINNKEREKKEISHANISENKNSERAFEYLQNKYPIRFEISFLKDYSDKFSTSAGKTDFINSFNNAIDIEIENNKIQWKPNSLFARLDNYARNWIKNESKSNNYKLKSKHKIGDL